MQCPACAAENPADYRFCDTCGAALVRCGQALIALAAPPVPARPWGR